MRIELFHASKFGNGARVADQLQKVMVGKGHQMNVHHIKESNPRELPQADLFIFGSPTRFGKPLGSMRRFVKKVSLPPGTKYALFATHGDAVPDKKTGRMPTEEEMNRYRNTIPVMTEILGGKGLVKVSDMIFLVSGETLRGPLKAGWEAKVEEFATAVLQAH